MSLRPAQRFTKHQWPAQHLMRRPGIRPEPQGPARGSGRSLRDLGDHDACGRGAGGQRDCRPGDRVQAAGGTEPEAGVVGIADPGIGHVHQAAGDRDAVGPGAAGGNHAAGHHAERAAGVDPGDGTTPPRWFTPVLAVGGSEGLTCRPFGYGQPGPALVVEIAPVYAEATRVTAA